MAQARYVEYNTAATSVERSQQYNGPIRSGRYSGFDVFTPGVGTLGFTLGHSDDSAKHVSIGEITGNNLGVWKTPFGTVIREDATVSGFTVDTNAANAYERIDLVVGQHYYNEAVAGGQAATYLIIKGDNGGVGEPELPSPSIQTIIGRIYIPASASNLNNATYEYARSPALGGYLPALLNQKNAFTAEVLLNESDTVLNVETVNGDNVIALSNTANSYRININGKTDIAGISNKQVGSEISLVFFQASGNQYINLLSFESLHADNQEDYSPFLIPGIGIAELRPYQLIANVSYTFRKTAFYLLGSWIEYWALMNKSSMAVQEVYNQYSFTEAKQTTNYDPGTGVAFFLRFVTGVTNPITQWVTDTFTPERSGRYLVTVKAVVKLEGGSADLTAVEGVGIAMFKDGVIDKYLDSLQVIDGAAIAADVPIVFQGSGIINLTGSQTGAGSTLKIKLMQGALTAFSPGWTQIADSTYNINWIQIQYLGN